MPPNPENNCGTKRHVRGEIAPFTLGFTGAWLAAKRLLLPRLRRSRQAQPSGRSQFLVPIPEHNAQNRQRAENAQDRRNNQEGQEKDAR